ncbi:uncharacterized protein DUF397 [Nocardiopsis sp. Huas11]|uniref:DUF397 domain-containing protein n=1 Tax=Nocardiopsis sp. Huas11 TaxID=2183912 RepID=UPI000F0EE824|nr:DUF397 domain-containing protein [Nocardiopsis sp. Huas11]RKS05363.1 uncharacterized protein DUF397 [Nocardiopsis sp. Huas11]
MGSGSDVTGVQWWKSSYSDFNSNCVEVAEIGDRLCVRDSRNAELGFLGFTRDEWTAFLEPVSGV